MVAVTFDTLAYSKTLQEAGIPPKQADALATAQKTAIDEVVAAKDLVTKHDLFVALAELKHDMLKGIFGLLIAQSALLIAILAHLT